MIELTGLEDALECTSFSAEFHNCLKWKKRRGEWKNYFGGAVSTAKQACRSSSTGNWRTPPSHHFIYRRRARIRGERSNVLPPNKKKLTQRRIQQDNSFLFHQGILYPFHEWNILSNTLNSFSRGLDGSNWSRVALHPVFPRTCPLFGG